MSPRRAKRCELDYRPETKIDDLISRLLEWYDSAGRSLPWREKTGASPDPYRVWLSEIMLQQTTVATVGPYFEKFIARWPTVADLAAADLDEILTAWAGLGYYARARNLHKCAQAVAAVGGVFPDTIDGLSQLPGIGPYTASAVAAIAFNRPVVPVDGNIERVTARMFAVEAPLPGSKAELRMLAAGFAGSRRPGDVAQALMDLGATVCRPRNPDCGGCPWSDACAGQKAGLADELPKREAKKTRPIRRAVAFWLVRDDGAVLLRRRPEKGLLGGMLEIPSTPWESTRWRLAEAESHAPITAAWRRRKGRVGHTFTHFHLEVSVWTAAATDPVDGLWIRPADFDAHAVPTLTRKLARHALGG